MNPFEISKRHSIQSDGPQTNPYEGTFFGNGDLAASVTTYSHGLTLTLGKNDVWDARFDGKPDEVALRHDELKRYTQEHGFEWHHPYSEDPQWETRPPDGADEDIALASPFQHPHAGRPAPKRVGQLRIVHPGLSWTDVHTELSVATGILTVTFEFVRGELCVEAFIHRDRNALFVRTESRGEIPWFSVIVQKEPDDSDPNMPRPDVELRESRRGFIRQEIPSDGDVDAFEWCMDARFSQKSQCKPPEVRAYDIRQECHLEDGESTSFGVGVGTSRDGTDTPQMIAESEVGQNGFIYHTLRETHIDAWEKFWSPSGVDLGDRALEAVWYQDLFGLACHLRPGAQAPGLQANIPMEDSSPFHGDYHWNHNVQKYYYAMLPVNHPEYLDVYADLVEAMMPTFAYLADLIFDLDGVYCDLITFPFVPPERNNVHNHFGRSLAMTGWVGQLLWWHWEFTRDRAWLADRAYPYLKQAAQFYWRYLEKYSDEDGTIYPSMRLEQPGWTKDFRHNRNVLTDLVMFENAFLWARSAATELGVDDEWRERWRTAQENLPTVEYGWTDDDEGWIALDAGMAEQPRGSDIKSARYDRWGGGGWLVFPGEYVRSNERAELAAVVRDMLRRVDLFNPSGEDRTTLSRIHSISSIMPLIRLGMTERFGSVRRLILDHRLPSGQASGFASRAGEMPTGPLLYHWRMPENKYLGAFGVTEMLLQSHGECIELFPCWPEYEPASFTGFRARGGFIIDAEWSPDNAVTMLNIYSTAGEECRIAWPYDDEPNIVDNDDSRVPIDRDEETIAFATQAGESYRLR